LMRELERDWECTGHTLSSAHANVGGEYLI
jgi:hypothetical protein